MTELILYNRAKQALEQATKVDEVKDIRDQSIAMAAYARQAKDTEMEALAVEIRLRAERRIGQIMEAQRQAGLLKVGKPRSKNNGSASDPLKKPITLEELGVGKRMADTARKLCTLPEAEFNDYVAESKAATDKAIRNVLRQKTKKADRAAREQALGTNVKAFPTGKFGVLYLDLPWRFEVYNRDTGLDRAADNHYPTMSLEEMAALPIADLAAKHSSIWMWSTAPFLAPAIQLMEGWGFRLKAHVIWRKDKRATGYWFWNVHEILLLGTRGNIPAPAPGEQWPSVVDAPAGRHSAKPEVFYQLIEAYFPTLPKVELFARNARPGWESWGNEVDAA